MERKEERNMANIAVKQVVFVVDVAGVIVLAVVPSVIRK